MAIPSVPITRIIDSVAQENDTFSIIVDFTYSNDSALTPNTLTWTLTDLDGNVINGRSAEDLTPASTITVTLTGDDLGVTSTEFAESGDFVTRSLFLDGTYDDADLGLSDLHISKEVRFSIYKGTQR